LPPALRDAIAWDTLDDASGAFADLAHGYRHNDLLFAAQLREGGDGSALAPAPAFLLLEHQSTVDPAMPLRVLAYQTRIWSRFRKAQPGACLPPIISILISHARHGWTAAGSFEQLLHPAVRAIPGLAALVPRCSMIVDDLAGQSDDDLRARSLPPSQKLALWLLRDARAPGRLLERFDAWSSTILEAGRTRSGREAITVLIQYLFEVLEPRYFDAVRAKLQQLGARSKEISVTIAEYLREEGRKEGRLATLRSQLLYKFQALDAEAEARLQAATPEALDRYLRRVLTANSLAAVFKAEGRVRTQRRSARGTGQSGASSSRPRRRARTEG
jgi:Putative transposase, YhgA-like